MSSRTFVMAVLCLLVLADGHTLSIFEALTGQIDLVAVVSLIVTNLGRRSDRSLRRSARLVR